MSKIPFKYDQEVVTIFLGRDLVEEHQVPHELMDIQLKWRELADKTGDCGCCTLGEGMLFEYQSTWYFMKPCSPWQGEGSWLPHVNQVKTWLEGIGATDIRWDCGIMD